MIQKKKIIIRQNLLLNLEDLIFTLQESTRPCVPGGLCAKSMRFLMTFARLDGEFEFKRFISLMKSVKENNLMS